LAGSFGINSNPKPPWKVQENKLPIFDFSFLLSSKKPYALAVEAGNIL